MTGSVQFAVNKTLKSMPVRHKRRLIKINILLICLHTFKGREQEHYWKKMEWKQNDTAHERYLKEKWKGTWQKKKVDGKLHTREAKKLSVSHRVESTWTAWKRCEVCVGKTGKLQNNGTGDCTYNSWLLKCTLPQK